jgi:hypothetical protein
MFAVHDGLFGNAGFAEIAIATTTSLGSNAAVGVSASNTHEMRVGMTARTSIALATEYYINTGTSTTGSDATATFTDHACRWICGSDGGVNGGADRFMGIGRSDGGVDGGFGCCHQIWVWGGLGQGKPIKRVV